MIRWFRCHLARLMAIRQANRIIRSMKAVWSDKLRSFDDFLDEF